MGTPNVDTYRRLVFHRVFPMLEGAWGHFGTPWTSLYAAEQELLPTGPGKRDILWMFHPSYRHSNPQFPQLNSKAEKRRHREAIWARTVRHLSSYA